MIDKKKYEALSVRDIITAYQLGRITKEQLANILTIKIAIIGGGDWQDWGWLEKRMKDIFTRILHDELAASLLASDCKNIISKEYGD